MATIAKRDGKFRVQIRRQGQGSISKTFTLRKDAERWARETEAAIEAGRYTKPKVEGIGEDAIDPNTTTLQALVERYRDAVTANKRGCASETAILNAFNRNASLAAKKLSDITPTDWARYRDARLKEIKPISVKRQLSIFSRIYEVARAEWGLKIDNPLASVSLEYVDQRRDRRLKEGELDCIITEAKRRRNPLVLQVILWAKETGMRRGEILAMRWEHIDIKARVLSIPISKNGLARKIPVTKAMMGILEGQEPDNATVFPIKPSNLKLTWARILTAVGIADLHFHDLRHEAISTLFEKGLAIQEVASISGHQSWKMLQRYTHPKPQDILRKLELVHNT
jgi:integrase